jgi:hypothetical protein
VVLFAAFLSIPLTGCSTTKDKPSSGMTEITLDCARYAGTAKRITDAQTELYQGSGGTEAVDRLVTELDGLRDGAPPDVKAALAELGEAFRKAQQVMAHPTPGSAAELSGLGPKLSADSQKVTAYIVSRCH